MNQRTSEEALSQLLDQGQFDAATTMAIHLYGPELLGFLRARLPDLEAAREVFALFAEDLWRGLPTFRRESSVRTWVYAIARNAAYRYGRRELKPRLAFDPISQVSRASALAVQLPTSPSQTDSERRVAVLRERLEDEERTILSLRIDKNMKWPEVAFVMLFDGETPSPDAIEREAARLRQRFLAIKSKLRKWLAETPS